MVPGVGRVLSEQLVDSFSSTPPKRDCGSLVGDPVGVLRYTGGHWLETTRRLYERGIENEEDSLSVQDPPTLLPNEETVTGCDKETGGLEEQIDKD